ncbi:MAG: hypothetical protein ACXVEE_16315, partial [Polyangiales bacterium]
FSLGLALVVTMSARRWIGARAVAAFFVGLAPLAYPMGRVLGRYVEALRDLPARWARLDTAFSRMPTAEWRLDTFYGSGNWRSIEKVALSWTLIVAVTTAVALFLPRRAIVGLALVATLCCALATGASWACDRPFSTPRAWIATLPEIHDYQIEKGDSFQVVRHGTASSARLAGELESVRHDPKLDVDVALVGGYAGVLTEPGQLPPPIPVAWVPRALLLVGLACALTALVLLAPLARRRQREIVGGAPYRDAAADPSLQVRAAIAFTVAVYGAAPLLRLLSERALWR